MIGKFFAKLFSSASSDAEKSAPATAPVEHKGFLIHAEPRQEGGQWQIAGRITREKDGEIREETFIRADKCVSKDEADAMCLRKGQQIINEQGERLFSN